MEPAKIILALSALPEWQCHGEIISRTFAFKDFPAAMTFVNQIADLAEQAQHHRTWTSVGTRSRWRSPRTMPTD